MNIDFSNYSASQRYHLMTQTIIPRPIAWALTESGDINNDNSDGQSSEKNNINLAPFSYFSAVSSDPALLMISVGKKPNGKAKDTLVNILKNKKVTIHIANETQAELMTKTAASLAHGESELKLVDDKQLNTVAFEGFELPRLAQCDIAYGCELYEIKELNNASQTLIFLEVKQLYINPDVVTVSNDNRIKIHADAVKPLARLGASEYAAITTPFKVARPE